MAFVDAFGDRMKAYEVVETSRRLDARTTPVYARLDGRGFSNFTRDMIRPYDGRMGAAMQATCAALVEHTGALVGYTQSDEISLVWAIEEGNPFSEMMFNGKLQKLTSVLASYGTAAFTKAILASPDESFRAYADRLPHFDARVFALPNREEATNAFLWRANDAERNAVSMAAHTHFSHLVLQGVSQRGMVEMMTRNRIDFDAYPDAFRFGSFYRRDVVDRTISEPERLAIPERFRPNEGAIVTRTELNRLENLGSFRKVVNRVDVIFGGATPISST